MLLHQISVKLIFATLSFVRTCLNLSTAYLPPIFRPDTEIRMIRFVGPVPVKLIPFLTIGAYIPIVPFHKDFSPSGEQLEHRK